MQNGGFDSPMRRRAVLVLSLLASCTPIHRWHAHTTSVPSPPPLGLAELGQESVATLGVVAPAGLQGAALSVSQGLVTAFREAAPSVRVVPNLETVSVLNEHGLAPEYGDLISGFARSGILERDRLHRIGSALGCRYVLLPGLGALDQAMIDRFDFSGLKVVQRRITTLRLWLQLWDSHTGRMLWESSGEATVATELLRPERTVPLEGMARRLWLRMLRDGLLERRSQ